MTVFETSDRWIKGSGMLRFLCLLLCLLGSTSLQAAKLLILGDSLSAGYQMATEQSWPALLDQYWQQQSSDHSVINASISGETTDGGLRRLPRLLAKHKPDWILVELGANDGLRGFSPAQTRLHLQQIVRTAREAGSKPVLMQIRLPRNYGKRYLQLFESIYPELAAAESLPLLPFLLEEIALKPELMMADGLHPTAAAQAQIATSVRLQLETIWSTPGIE